LVTEPAPAPEPPQATPAPPAPAAQHYLTSGKDQQTTAPPQADAEGPEAAPKPQQEAVEADVPTPAQTKPAPPTLPASPKIKEAARETAPQPRKQGSVNRAPGETEQEGDPYLNQLWGMIEQHRTYPAGAVGSLGLNLEGTATYLIEVSPAGALQAMRLERSSGASVLDDTARKMIQQAAPFPPLPGYYPRNGVVLTVTIHLFPTAS
jgi:protein TonB